MRKLIFILALALCAPAFAASGLHAYFKTEPVKIGGGKYYYKGLIHAYDAALYSANGKFDPDKMFALELIYQTDIDGDDIAVKSIEEMNKISAVDKDKADKWLEQMKAIFPNVVDGTNITGINIPGKGVVFLKDGKKIGQIDDTEFSQRFFDIWLNPKTSGKKLRAKLLGDK